CLMFDSTKPFTSLYSFCGSTMSSTPSPSMRVGTSTKGVCCQWSVKSSSRKSIGSPLSANTYNPEGKLSFSPPAGMTVPLPNFTSDDKTHLEYSSGLNHHWSTNVIPGSAVLL